MLTPQIPAGLTGTGMEIFKGECNSLFFLQDGEKKPYSMIPNQYRSLLINEMLGDTKACHIMSECFGLKTIEDKESMFVGCRYGNLDYTADIVDGNLYPDAPRCDKIFNCPGFGVICQVPKISKGGLTPQEYKVIVLISEGYQTKEISNFLGISNNTTRTHIQRVHSKLGVNNNVEVAKWAYKRKIV